MRCIVCDRPTEDDLCGLCWERTPEALERILIALELVGDEYQRLELEDTKRTQRAYLGRVA